jgi:DNA-directed RNA polymerase subunit RPC12/RpoP
MTERADRPAICDGSGWFRDCQGSTFHQCPGCEDCQPAPTPSGEIWFCERCDACFRSPPPQDSHGLRCSNCEERSLVRAAETNSVRAMRSALHGAWDTIEKLHEELDLCAEQALLVAQICDENSAPSTTEGTSPVG